MKIAERHNCVASGNTATRTSKIKCFRHVGAILLGLAVVLACSANAAAQQSIWPSSTVPAAIDNGNSGPLELGVSFKSDVSGTITGIRFYKSSANTGTHVGRLWSPTGALLASVTFTGETSSGWQQVNFSTPVAITANTVYVASYGLTIGHFSANWNYFATSGFNNAPLHALQTPDGVYGNLGTFPVYTHQAANYWVDVVFKAVSSTAPSISSQPASKTVVLGQTASFSVAVTGTTPLSYQWQKNGAAINGATSSSYTTPATASTDNGALFAVVVSNSVGKVTSNSATLTVNSAPAITSQPASKTVIAGQTATFAVTATGGTPLSYQWQKNGTAISGAISASYTTPAETAADNGAQFTAVVSNTAGSATSNSATLTVNASTLVLNASPASLSFGSIDTGATSTLGVTLTNSGNSSVTISSVSTSGPGFSASNMSSGTILAPGQTAALNVTFAPTSTGSLTGGVTVASNATNSPATISMTGTGVQSNLSTWVAPSLNRVGQTDVPGTLSSIVLSGARGETVDTQVVVQGPAGGLTNVNVSASALTGPNGVTIPASNVTLYREYYLSVTGTASYGGGSNPPLGSGTYAEPLIPFNDPETGAALCGSSASLKACNASVNAGQNQPYWIDISIPHGASNSPAGTYTGSVTISSSQGTSTIPVSLTVWNFELPMQPSELSLWTLWPPASGNTTTTLARALMRDKVMSWYDVASNASSDVTNMGLNRSGLDNNYYIGIQCNGGYSSIPSTSQINAAAANFPAGLGLDFYMADELNGCTGDYSDIRTLGANAHAANRSVKTMMTLNATDANLYGSVDHWVLLDSMQQWPALPFTAGGDLWSYTSCNAGYGNTPEWMVDYPPINERIQAGFLNFTQGATGLLYYRADGWTAGNAIGSWNNVDTTACGGGLGRPGDGIFLYPPAPIASTESAPGIRLKAIRDGIQDYEYAQMLKNLGQLGVVDNTLLPIATSWSNWSHDPNALQNARTALGQLLHQLAP
jgi:Domain of unknown function (DUF4082)/Domain of unknown function (DUF4091)/Abnormal spindle-like microcephaly-assoc'd, ASPM-SPD-2-Hydin/Immunoglobulin I-set domain